MGEIETQIAILYERLDNTIAAIKIEAVEIERRLQELNHEGERIRDIQNASVSAEKFQDYEKSQRVAVQLALDSVNNQLDIVRNLSESNRESITEINATALGRTDGVTTSQRAADRARAVTLALVGSTIGIVSGILAHYLH